MTKKLYFRKKIIQDSKSKMNNKSTTKIRIKDIAEKAGTSIGTVDRVLHGRPNVSENVRQRVENAIKELGYEPNRYASALAFNKTYTFSALFPSPEIEPYWKEVSQGIHDAIREYRDFNLSINEMHYDIYDSESYHKALHQILKQPTNGVIVTPQLTEQTYEFCRQLEEREIPYTFLDANIKDLNALTFYGQDSRMSGFFAARMTTLEVAPYNKEVLIIHFDIPSLQQHNREVGFMDYMQQNFPEIRVHRLTVNARNTDIGLLLDNFFQEHPGVHFICTFCSHSHKVADYIHDNHINNRFLMGYDLLDENQRYLKEGIIRFLIAQHPWQQGFGCVDALFHHIVLKKEVKRTNFMPIELLTAENCDFYLKNAKTTF